MSSFLKNSIDKDGFNNILNSLKKQTNIDDVTQDIKSAANIISSVRNGVVAKNANSNVGNIESLVTLNDKSDPDNIEDVGPVRLKNPIQGFNSDFETTPTNVRPLEAITGKSPVSGKLKSHVIASTPLSIFNNIQSITGNEPSQSLMNNFTTEPTGEVVQNIKKTQGNNNLFGNALFSQLLSKLGSINNFEGGLLNNLLLLGTDVLRNELTTITRGLLKENVLKSVLQEILLGNKEKAAQIVENALSGSNLSATERDKIFKDVYKIDPSLSNVVSGVPSSTDEFSKLLPPTVKVERLNSNEQNYPENTRITKGGSYPYEFKFVDSFEELIADFRGASREITEVVVHWSAHFNNQGNVGSEECHNIAIDRGFGRGISYHYIIKKDGSIQRGRPLNMMGAHAKANGHNKYSIGISMIGGYNCNSNNPTPNNFISAESITSSQWNSLNQFLRAFYVVWPGGQVWGHNETDPTKVDPGISMKQYILSKFNKTNKSSSGSAPPLSPAQLVGANNSKATPS